MGTREHVVLVEDDDGVASLLDAVLRSTRGDEVRIERHTRVEGTASALLADPPDLVLVDVRLLDGSGLDIVRRLREVHDSVDLPVLVLTGSSEPGALDEAFRAGASDFIRKPCTMQELTHRIDVHLRAQGLRRQLGERLEQREREVVGLGRVLDSLDVAVWVLDRDGHTVLANRHAETPEGMAVRRAAAEQIDLDAPPPDGPAEQLRVTWTDDDGELVAHDLVRQRVRIEDLGPGAQVLAAYEASERARAREVLEQALVATDRAHATRTRFLTAVSHELRTPLTVIGGVFESARRQVADPELARLLEAGVRQSMRLRDLVLDLLLVAQDGADALTRRSVDTADLVSDALARCSEAERVDTRLVSGSFDADRDRLSRALAAVLDNALRFSPVGSRCRLTAAVLDDEVRFVVEDAGPGIHVDFRDEVFEPFARGNADVSHSPGAGIGLTVARILVRAHGGRIELGSSEDLGGAEVRIVIPTTIRLDEEADAEAPTHLGVDTGPSGRRAER
jgi:signal transduction histidine kinase